MVRSGKRFDMGIILIAAIVIIIAGTIVFLYSRVKTDLVSEYIDQEKEIPVAFLVSENDQIIISNLVIFHPVTNKTAVIDVPPNTSTLIKSMERFDRMDMLYTHGQPEEYIAEMSQLLDVEIPFYIDISINDLNNFITVLGGVEVFIAYPVEEVSEEKIVLLPSGRVNLDGDKAVTFIRYSDQDAQLEEITDRKLAFVKALMFSLGKQYEMLGNGSVSRLLSKYYTSNLNRQALQTLFTGYSAIEPDSIAVIETLGKIQMLEDLELLLPRNDGQLIKQNVEQARESLAKLGTPGTDDLVIVLEILNGTDITGLASRTAQLFASYGFDVDIFGNADHNEYENTMVLDRTGNISLAQRVASVINCQRIETEVYSENTAGIDVTVILGKDFDERTVKN